MAVREYGDGLLCAKSGTEAKDWVETRKRTGKDHVRARRLDLMRKSQERRAKALKTGAEGDGRTRSCSKTWAPFLEAMRNGTKRCSAGRTDVLSGERERSWGQRVGFTGEYRRRFILYSHTPFKGVGVGGTNPLSSTHMARPRPFVPSSFSLTGIVCCRAPFSSLLFIWDLFLLQEGCSHPVVSCCAWTRRRRTRTDAKQRIIRKKVCNFVLLSIFFYGKGEVFIYFGSLVNVSKTF